VSFSGRICGRPSRFRNGAVNPTEKGNNRGTTDNDHHDRCPGFGPFQEVLWGGLGNQDRAGLSAIRLVQLRRRASALALYEWEAAAQDAGVSPEGSGFRGVSFHYIVDSKEVVDEVMGKAKAAGGGVVKEAAASPYGYSGYFSDPDGHLWKVASGS
jgi:catechol 2,3-dioxygenase-like lactoylglutathione lyase family enzyme